MRSIVKWLLRAGLVVATSYVVLLGALVASMLQPPARFGSLMRYAPMPLVWGALPGQRVWMWARQGNLVEGATAPDFSLPTPDRTARVTLSSIRGHRPVVLVFGSYT
jgi:hypothetical protein